MKFTSVDPTDGDHKIPDGDELFYLGAKQNTNISTFRSKNTENARLLAKCFNESADIKEAISKYIKLRPGTSVGRVMRNGKPTNITRVGDVDVASQGTIFRGLTGVHSKPEHIPGFIDAAAYNHRLRDIVSKAVLNQGAHYWDAVPAARQ